MEKDIPKQPLLFAVFATKPHRKWVISAFIFVTLASLLSGYSVVILQHLTDAIAARPIRLETIWIWGIAYPLIFLLSECIWRLSGFTGMRWFMGMRSTIYQQLYEYLSLHSKDYFSSRFAGPLTNKISNAVEGYDSLAGEVLWDFFPLVLTIIWFTLFAGFNNIWLGLTVLVWASLFIGINIWSVKKLQPYSYQSAHALSTLKGRLVDSLSNISLVQEYAHVSGEKKYIGKFIKKQYYAGLAHWWFSEWILVANGVLISFFMLFMIGSAILLFQNHIVSIGVIVMSVAIVSNLANQFFFIGQEMTNATKYYGEIKEGLSEILKIHSIVDSPNALALQFSKGEIVFDSVNFDYENTKVFKNFSLTIHPGQKIGFVGRSGAGKSTFVSLLLRHFDIQEGKITIDGQDLQDVTLESLRKIIAFVPQDTSLFHRTIRENIQYSNPDATDKEIILAAKQAQADEFIQTLPEKYDTLVGERGVKLSGGQRQRIAIARAFLKNAPILILDEATSSLDSESEHAIQHSLEELMKGRTVIAIAHRLSTLKKMDRILILKEGTIVEDGNPDDLLKKNDGIFKSMWNHQVSGFILDE